MKNIKLSTKNNNKNESVENKHLVEVKENTDENYYDSDEYYDDEDWGGNYEDEDEDYNINDNLKDNNKATNIKDKSKKDFVKKKKKKKKKNKQIEKKIYDEFTVDEAKKTGKLYFEKVNSKFLEIICWFFGIILLVLIFGVFDILKGKEPLLTVPWYFWIIDFILFKISLKIYNNFSSSYSLDLNKQALIAEYDLFSTHKEFIKASFNEIKLFGVSTEAIYEADREKFRNVVNYKHELIVVYGDFNLRLVLKKTEYNSSLYFLNKLAGSAAYIVKCKFIPSDCSSKIVIKRGVPNDSIDSLIKLIPKEQQLPNVDFKKAPEGDSAK